MQRWHFATALFFTLSCIAGFPGRTNSAQTDRVNTLPEVILAVAPAYPPIAVSANAGAEVVVDVEINQRGLVTSTRAVTGHKIFKDYSERAAKRWQFSAVMNEVGVRRAQITFIYKIVPNNTPAFMKTPTFSPPYRVEVYHGPPEDVPLPQQKVKKPSRSRS